MSLLRHFLRFPVGSDPAPSFVEARLSLRLRAVAVSNAFSQYASLHKGCSDFPPQENILLLSIALPKEEYSLGAIV